MGMNCNMENQKQSAVGKFVSEKILPPIMKFVNTRPVRALQDGMVYALPLLLLVQFS